ncbi:MAG: DUF3320 domain-containing protein [Bacillota bacterium]|nr:DUF3320 domain-containing protein [Bacillota bacterium]
MDWWDNRDRELTRILQKLQDVQSNIAIPEPEVTTAVEAAPEPESSPAAMLSAEIASAPLKTVPPYEAASIPVTVVSPEEFVKIHHEQLIREKTAAVIATVAPVSRSLLMRQVVQSCGIARAGGRIQRRLNSILKKMNLQVTKQENELFYWREDQNPLTMLVYVPVARTTVTEMSEMFRYRK